MTGKCDMETCFANCLVWIKDHLWDTYENRLCLLRSNYFDFIIIRVDPILFSVAWIYGMEAPSFQVREDEARLFLFAGSSKHFIGSCSSLDKATRNEVLLFYLVIVFFIFLFFFIFFVVFIFSYLLKNSLYNPFET